MTSDRTVQRHVSRDATTTPQRHAHRDANQSDRNPHSVTPPVTLIPVDNSLVSYHLASHFHRHSVTGDVTPTHHYNPPLQTTPLELEYLPSLAREDEHQPSASRRDPHQPTTLPPPLRSVALDLQAARDRCTSCRADTIARHDDQGEGAFGSRPADPTDTASVKPEDQP